MDNQEIVEQLVKIAKELKAKDPKVVDDFEKKVAIIRKNVDWMVKVLRKYDDSKKLIRGLDKAKEVVEDANSFVYEREVMDSTEWLDY